MSALSMTDDLHPTPQLRRADWHELDGAWEFAHDDEDRGLAEHWYAPEHRLGGEIIVPFPPESSASGIGDTGFHSVLWYRRTFEVGTVPVGERILLHFGAVDYSAVVFLNGHRVGSHRGGMTPFAIDITDRLTDGEQVLVVRAEDDPHDVGQPRGKQDWRSETHGIFYERTSGIWQPVWWESVPEVHVTDLYWTSDLGEASVDVEVTLASAPKDPAWVQVVLTKGDETLAEQRVRVQGRRTSISLFVPGLAMPMERGRLIWSPENPTLLDARVEVITDPSEGSAATDIVDSYLGVRSVGFADGRFTLNGHPYFLRMVLEQGYWPTSHLAAPSTDALRAEVELIKKLGFNGARVHQKIEDPRFLYWCDRLGLVVWGEMANAFSFSETAVEALVTEWMAAVRRDRSHPSIVAWIPMNESWGISDIAVEAQQQHCASTLYYLTRTLDPHRPAVSNEGWEHTESDIWGVHDYTPDGQSIRERYSPEGLERTLTDRSPGRRRVLLRPEDRRGQPVMITEFGGISYAPKQGENWFGYSTITSADEFAKRLDELISAIVDQPDLAGFCYTQLTDTLQETNGLLTADRESKLPIDDVHHIVTQPSSAIPSERVDAFRRAARQGKTLSADESTREPVV